VKVNSNAQKHRNKCGKSFRIFLKTGKNRQIYTDFLTGWGKHDTVRALKSDEKEEYPFPSGCREWAVGASPDGAREKAPLSCGAEMPCRSPPLLGKEVRISQMRIQVEPRITTTLFALSRQSAWGVFYFFALSQKRKGERES